MSVTFTMIQNARTRLREGIYHSPCPISIPISQIAGATVFCKLEYLQRTGSFKERGARNALMSLADDARGRGVVCASAGNHAQGMAHHGALLSIPVTVVMPRHAPLTKVESCRALGARVVLEGETFDEADAEALRLRDSENLTYINGFDHPEVIAGQGTLGLEILEQVPDVEAVVIPVGGAGLIAGVGLAIKTLRPEVRVVGVEPDLAPSFSAALREGKPTQVPVSPTLADGLAVAKVGDLSFSIAKEVVDSVVTVDESSLARAILRLLELEKSVVEGAGAAGLAAFLAGKVPELLGKRVVLPLCGGNIDTAVLGRIIERGLVAEGRLYRFRVSVSDRPGGLAGLTRIIADLDASVKEITHDRAFAGEDLNTVAIICVVETRNEDHIEEIRQRLIEKGFDPKEPQI